MSAGNTARLEENYTIWLAIRAAPGGVAEIQAATMTDQQTVRVVREVAMADGAMADVADAVRAMTGRKSPKSRNWSKKARNNCAF